VPTHFLHVYLKDGDRVGLLDGRPADELAWAAHLLSCALESVPAASRSGPGEPAPVEASRVLPYEAPAANRYAIRVEKNADGSTTVVIPVWPGEQLAAVLPPAALLAILIAAAVAVALGPFARDAWTAKVFLLALVGLAVAGVARVIRRHVLRGAEPVTVVVDATHVRVNVPTEAGPKRWPRAKVTDVNEGSGTGQASGRKFVQILMHEAPPVKLAAGRGDWDRRRVLLALREALGMVV
jgi:hypothetical protein